MREVVLNFFTNADGTLSLWRVAVVVVVSIGLWRAVFLLAQASPSPLPPEQPVSASAQTRASWFPSKADRVAAAAELAKGETMLVVSQREQLIATAEFERAKTELAALRKDISGSKDSEAKRATPPAALTFAEIDNLLHLLDLAPELHQRIAGLVAARIEEKSHEQS